MSQDPIDSTINSTCKVHLEAVDRISKLPVVELSVQVTTSVYNKIKVHVKKIFEFLTLEMVKLT